MVFIYIYKLVICINNIRIAIRTVTEKFIFNINKPFHAHNSIIISLQKTCFGVRLTELYGRGRKNGTSQPTLP